MTAAGTGRSVVKELDAGGASLTQNLTGLPLGTVIFTGEAFAAACSAVSKSSIAAWASDAVETSIVLGRLANVTLVMNRNGRAKVDVSFSEEAACTRAGNACRIPSECCSRRCVGGLCAVSDAAAHD